MTFLYDSFICSSHIKTESDFAIWFWYNYNWISLCIRVTYFFNAVNGDELIEFLRNFLSCVVG